MRRAVSRLTWSEALATPMTQTWEHPVSNWNKEELGCALPDTCHRYTKWTIAALGPSGFIGEHFTPDGGVILAASDGGHAAWFYGDVLGLDLLRTDTKTWGLPEPGTMVTVRWASACSAERSLGGDRERGGMTAAFKGNRLDPAWGRWMLAKRGGQARLRAIAEPASRAVRTSSP
jgi:hypothetical protein